MDWIDLMERGEFLRQIFPDSPSLHGVRVHEICCCQDGPRVLIRFDLREYPQKPPAKWIQAGANTVQLRLMGMGVRQLEARGWTANNIAGIVIEAIESGGVRFAAQGDGFYFKAAFEHIMVDGVSAYTTAP